MNKEWNPDNCSLWNIGVTRPLSEFVAEVPKGYESRMFNIDGEVVHIAINPNELPLVLDVEKKVWVEMDGSENIEVKEKYIFGRMII